MDLRRFSGLKTKRLTLRPAYDADPDELAAGLNDWGVARWLSRAPYPYTRADAVELQEMLQTSPEPSWSIFDADGFVGGIGLVGHLGYWLARPAWGRGYAYEAAHAVLAVHFGVAQAGDVEAAYFVGNDASAHILRRLGFVETGPTREYSRAHDGEVDGIGLVLTRAAWQAAQADPVPQRA